MKLILLFFLLCFAGWIITIVYLFLNYQKKIKRRIYWDRLRNWVKAIEACQKWRECNPFTHISHPEAQTLLRMHNGCYMLFLEVDPDSDDGKLEDFIKLMED
jgi:hypothetical protein